MTQLGVGIETLLDLEVRDLISIKDRAEARWRLAEDEKSGGGGLTNECIDCGNRFFADLKAILWRGWNENIEKIYTHAQNMVVKQLYMYIALHHKM